VQRPGEGLLRHEEAVPLLPDLAHECLDRETAASLMEHLAACDECRRLSETYGLFFMALRRPKAAAAQEHLPSAEIVAYAVGIERPEGEALTRIVSHLRSCPQCTEEVERTRQVEEKFREEGMPAPGRFVRGLSDMIHRPALSPALAVGIVLLVLGYPAFLGLYRLPQVAGEVSRLRKDLGRVEAESQAEIEALNSELEQRLQELRQAAAQSAPVEVHFLAGPSRDEGPGTVIKLEADQRSVVIGVSPGPQQIRPGSFPYRFEIASRGQTLLSWEMTGAQIRRYLGSAQGAVIFSIPSSDLPPGNYELTLSSGEGPGRKRLLLIPFDVAR
jgi:hypothetical protein